MIAISFWNDVDTQALAESFGAVALLDKMRLVSELIPAVKDSTVTQPSKNVRSPRVGVTIEAEEHATEAKNSSNSGEPTASVPKQVNQTLFGRALRDNSLMAAHCRDLIVPKA